MSHSPRFAAASPPVLPTLSSLVAMPRSRRRPTSRSSPTQWLPITTRSAGSVRRPISRTSTAVPASTSSTSAGTVTNPSAWAKLVTAPDPLPSG